MSYLEFFGLSSEPFSNAPVSRFFYNAPQHQQALTRLLYATSTMKGLAVLVGEIGAGKTTLARRLLDSLPEEEYEAALLVIIHSGITASWLLRRIALQLGVENPAQEKLALLSQLYQRLLQIYEQGRKAVVLIDEAQMLETRELMEEFRGLLNLEVPERKLISFVLFGLPDIEKNLRLDPPLAQRVAMRYRLEPFTAASTEAYVKHRLRLAGSQRMPFAPEAIEAVHRRSAGTPRVINTICDNALFEASLARAGDIRSALIESIADNLGLEAGADVAAQVPSPAPAPAPAPAPQPRPAPRQSSSIPPVSRPSSAAPTPVPGPPPTIPDQGVAAQLTHLDAEVLEEPVFIEEEPHAAALPPPPPKPSAPRPSVDLAEIDRYLEGLGKL
jgi:general secretion pathway protein A